MAKSTYTHSVGRRKRAIARIRLFKTKGDNLVNGLSLKEYFPGLVYQTTCLEPLKTCNALDKYHFTVKVLGSGKVSQIAAIVHGLSRALIKIDADTFKPLLKKKGLLTRDPRKRERRKVGTGGKARRKKQSPKR